MLSLLLAALVSTGPPFDVDRVAESATCESALVVRLPVDIDLESPLDQLSFSLQWTTKAEALGYPDYPEELAEVYQESVSASFSDGPLLSGIVLMTGGNPHQWPFRRQIAATAGRRFSLAGHQLANGATLTVYPDDGGFILTAPQDTRDEPVIGVLIARGTCDFVWSEGDGTGSAER